METEALDIDGVQYTVVDSLCQCVTGIGGRWEVGSLVSVILDVDNRRAFLQSDAAVSKAGDTMTGDLKINKASAPAVRLSEGTQNSSALLQQGGNQFVIYNIENAGVAQRALVLNNSAMSSSLDGALRLLDKPKGSSSNTWYNVVHAGNLEARGVARIQAKTYSGNGKYGESNPTSVTFDFVPKFVLICGADLAPFLLIQGIGQANQYSGWKENNTIWNVTWTNKTVSWHVLGFGGYDSVTEDGTYNVSIDARHQMNLSGRTYTAIAVG